MQFGAFPFNTIPNELLRVCSFGTYSVFTINGILFGSFCYREQNERNNVHSENGIGPERTWIPSIPCVPIPEKSQKNALSVTLSFPRLRGNQREMFRKTAWNNVVLFFPNHFRAFKGNYVKPNTVWSFQFFKLNISSVENFRQRNLIPQIYKLLYYTGLSENRC